MERKFKNKIKIALITSILTLIITIFNTYNNKTFAVEINEESQFTYLSDIPYEKNLSKAGWGSITMDKTTAEDGLNTLSLKIDGSAVVFKKGIFAHATSTVVYDVSNYNYDYFTTYYGVSAHKGSNGSVKFSIYTSVDGTTWDLKTEENPEVMTAASNAKFVKIDIRDVKYIKLYADSNGANGQDHSLYGDAKLIKEGYTDNVTKTVEEYDKLIKEKYNGKIDKDLELLLLQRNLVKKAGEYTLRTFVEEDSKNKETLDWIMNNQEALKLYTVGGKPDGTYARALNVLSNLYNTYKEDLNDETEFTNDFDTVKAKDLYLKMMLALSLTHSTDVYLWVDSSSKSDAVTRYAIYKDMHLKGKLNNNIFENLTVEEMRWVVNNIIDDEEIEWLNDLMKKRNLNDGHGAYQFITYRNGYNYSKDQYYDEENYDKWDEKYDLKAHNITYEKGHPRLWIVFEEGSVCGGLAKTWSNMRGARGIPSSVVGQPGHAAAITYSLDSNGNGIWNLVNDVSGWANSGRTERIGIRMPNEWGEYNIATYGATLKPDSYVILAQQAQNEYEKYEASEIVLLLEDVYKDNHEKLDEIYKKALQEESINFDALYGLVMLYKNDNTFTEEQCYELAERIAETYTYHPLPMYDLLRTLNSRFTTANYKARVATLQEQTLRKASVANANNALQYQVSRTVANTILGLTDNTIATFSFDGENSGKIILSSRFDGSEVRWEYSLNGGAQGDENWTQTGEKSVELTPEEIAKITAENDIKIHIVGVNYNPENIYTIDIQKANTPSGLYRNDLENKVIGTTDLMEWKIGDSNEWTSYKNALPDLTGDKTVNVRIGATGLYLPSNPIKMEFTEDNQPDTRKYIPISNLSVYKVSSEATSNNGHAIHTIDGNINTIWHSNYQGQDSQRYIIIKLSEPKYISALEYVPRQSGTNGRIAKCEMSLSMDGENFETVASETWTNNASTKVINLEESIETQYIKLQALTNYGDGRNFISALMINLFEDKTGDRPRAIIEYSTTEQTSKPVTATLKPLTEGVTITNNNGQNTYTFKENGEFTFEFIGSNGKTGTATARVNWMKNCEFSFDGNTPNTIILSEKYAPNNEDLENLTWEYSIDGGNTWNTINGKLTYTLTDEELKVITENNNIKLRVQVKESVIGPDEYTVDITGGLVLPSILYANDLENRIIGMTKDMEYRINESEDWISCKDVLPTFEGNKTVEVRYSAKGTTQAGPSKIFTFTEDEVNTKKTYIPIEYLSIESYSTQTDDTGRDERAVNVIDGNINTMWHSDHSTPDTQRYIVIKLKEPKFISHVQYIAKDNYLFGIMKDGNISVSLDDENWKTISEIHGENYTSTSQLVDKYIQEFEVEEPVYAQYIRFQCTESYDYIQKAGADYFISSAMLNLFEDTEKEWIDTIPPTSNVSYSTTESTKDGVIATIRFSEPVNILTSSIVLEKIDDLTYTYKFFENADLSVEYEDLAGNKGENIKLFVNWIEKSATTAKIEYSTKSLTNGNVIATISCDELIIITNNDGKNEYTFTENGTFIFKYTTDDNLVGEAKAEVSWIDKEVPTGTIEYSIKENTNKSVKATLKTSKNVTITNNNGKNTYTFTKNGEFTFEYIDKAGNKGTTTAKVDWIIKDEEPYFKSNIYSIKEGYISEVKEKTTLKEFRQNIMTNQQFIINDKNGNIISEETVIATGMTLNVLDKQYTIIVKGDIDQDGKVTVNDLAKLKLHLIGNITLENVSYKAADLDDDNNITLNDLARIKMSLIGIINL